MSSAKPTGGKGKTTFSLNRFAQSIGHLSSPVPYEQVAAVQLRDLWRL